MASNELNLETIQARLDGHVIRVELNRPGRRNAMNKQMLHDLDEVVTELAYRDDAKVLWISGKGKSFCAGYDVTQEPASGATRENWVSKLLMSEVFGKFEQAPVIRVAEIHGHAVGAGFSLASMCELRYATRDTIFCIPELDFGIPFSFGATNRLVRYVGVTHAQDMILNARRVTGAEAAEWGLVTAADDASGLSDRVEDVVAKLQARPGFLLLTTQATLAEAARAHTSDGETRMSATLMAQLDSESCQVSQDYVKKFAKR